MDFAPNKLKMALTYIACNSLTNHDHSQSMLITTSQWLQCTIIDKAVTLACNDIHKELVVDC